MPSLGASGLPLVLTKLEVNGEAAPEEQPYAEIVGRKAGLIAYLLTLMGMSPISRMSLTSREIRVETTTLYGEKDESIPLTAVGGLRSQMRKPLEILVFLTIAGVATMVGLASAEQAAIGFVLFLAFFLLGLFIWIYKRVFVVEVYSNGNAVLSIAFKPSVIEGVTVDFPMVRSFTALSRDLVISAQSPNQDAPAPMA